jgi:hypothetical protein
MFTYMLTANLHIVCLIRNRGTPTVPDCKCGPQPTNPRSKSTRTGTEVWTDRSIHCEVVPSSIHSWLWCRRHNSSRQSIPCVVTVLCFWRSPVFMPYFQSVMPTEYRSRYSDWSRCLTTEETYFSCRQWQDFPSLDRLWGPLVSYVMSNGGSFPYCKMARA